MALLRVLCCAEEKVSDGTGGICISLDSWVLDIFTSVDFKIDQ